MLIGKILGDHQRLNVFCIHVLVSNSSPDITFLARNIFFLHWKIRFLKTEDSLTPFLLFQQLSCQQYYTIVNNTVPAVLPGGCVENPKYYSYIAVLALIATIMLVQVSHMVKLTLMLMITGAVGVVNILAWQQIFDRYDQERFQDNM